MKIVDTYGSILVEWLGDRFSRVEGPFVNETGWSFKKWCQYEKLPCSVLVDLSLVQLCYGHLDNIIKE